MLKQNKQKLNKGFTIIELLVTMTMIAIVSATVFAARGNMENKLALQRASYKLNQSFREVAEMAMGSVEGSCGAKDICGFGLYFGVSDYTFFIDCSNNCDTSNHKKDGQDVDLRQVSLDDKIQISNTSSPNLSILFSPPDPIVYIDGNEWRSTGSDAVITLELNSETRNVTINSAGKITIE